MRSVIFSFMFKNYSFYLHLHFKFPVQQLRKIRTSQDIEFKKGNCKEPFKFEYYHQNE